MRTGFTLIELLVVVLIIAILAAVALPQYQFAVAKSKIMPYILDMQEIIRAEEIYYLENDEYIPSLDKLVTDFSHICGTLGGACHNEIYDCTSPVAFNLNAGNTTAGCAFNGTHPSMTLRMCESSICRTSNWSTDGRLQVSYQFDMKQWGCNVRNQTDTQAKKLCNYIMEIVAP